LINNFYPWDINSTCGGHLAQIANEFQLIILLVPILAYLYQNYNSKRKVLYMIFSVLGLMSLAAVVTITIEFNVDGYPGFMSQAFSDMYTKIYYRLPPFLIGVALAIFHFEYKHVDKLKDGSQPFHKHLIKDLMKNKMTFKLLSYGVGFLCCAIPILLLVQNSSCIADTR
jgi:peptidoglycan/LPS O-acetylase OafA/YrhL